MRELIYFLEKRYDLYLVGVEKSGEFADHAQEISHLLEPGQYIIPNSKYIYKYIIFGQENPNQPYGSSTYYSNLYSIISRSDVWNTFNILKTNTSTNSKSCCK